MEFSTVQQTFRIAMAHVASPVSVVTSHHDGAPHGTTVSAFASLSMDPPMLLVSLARSSDLLQMVERSGRFAVNVLGDAQCGLASTFASKQGQQKFNHVEWHLDDGLPRFPRSTAWIACDVAEIVDGGDHKILLGNVTRVEVSPGNPLIYHQRTFGTHRLLEQVAA